MDKDDSDEDDYSWDMGRAPDSTTTGGQVAGLCPSTLSIASRNFYFSPFFTLLIVVLGSPILIF